MTNSQKLKMKKNLAKARKVRAMKLKKSKKKSMPKIQKLVLKKVAKKPAAKRAKAPSTKKTKDFVVGFTNEVYLPVQVGRSYALLTVDNKTIDKLPGVSKPKIKQVAAEGKALRAFVNKSGKTQYKLVDANQFKTVASTIDESHCDSVEEAFETHELLKDFIHKNGMELKPEGLFMEELQWKYLIRSAVRGKNILMLGPTGCGKTLAAQSLVRALKRPDFYFNLGATQDPRATLIGNTHFNKDTGTFFSESAFVKAIKTPNAIILLDEISRAHPEAWNILMTVLDYNQRYLRLDEEVNSPIVQVANGVTFVATANVGAEYTSTRILDRAIRDRFVTIEMNPLDAGSEFQLLKFKFPQTEDYDLQSLAEIANISREMVKSDAGKLTAMVSTRVNVEAAGLIYDGFSLVEAAEIAILPYFSNDGGLDSERVYMRQLVQKYVKSTEEPLMESPIVDDTASNGIDTVKW